VKLHGKNLTESGSGVERGFAKAGLARPGRFDYKESLNLEISRNLRELLMKTPMRILLVWLAFVVSGQAAAVELILWEHEKKEEQEVLDKILANFMKANPTIKIKRAHYKTEDLRPQFQTAAMNPGGGPDVLIAPNDFAGPFAIMGIIQPVQSFAQLDRFFPSVVEAVTDSQKNTWGFPISNGNHLMLFVNKKLVPKTPETIEELITAAKKNSDPKRKTYGLVYNLTEPFWFVTFLSAYGVSPLVQEKPQLASAGMVQALNLVHDMKFKDKIIPADCDYTCADTLFTEGKAAMAINGDWAIQKYQEAFKKMKSELVIAPLPKSEATGQYMRPMVSGKYLFFNANRKGEQLEAAKKFAEFMVSIPSQELVAKAVGRLPALKAAAAQKSIADDPVLSATMKAMANGQPMPMAVEMRAIWDAMRPQLQAVMSGTSTADNAAKKMQQNAETKIKEMK